MMPGKSGTEICSRLRNERPDPYTYVILLTAKDAKEAVIEGLDAGADDYLTEPFHPLELQARLRVGLRLLELEDRLVQAREDMRYKAMHDILTGAFNRGAVLEAFERELHRARREHSSLGVLIGDLDHFKRINDTFGHLAGDSVLREVTRRLLSCVRPYDAIGRYGGEEFLILLPGCNNAVTAAKAEQLRNAVVGLPMETASGQLHVSMSLGGVTSEALPEAKADQLLQMADRVETASQLCPVKSRKARVHHGSRFLRPALETESGNQPSGRAAREQFVSLAAC